ncbi:MAG: hypothetical protein ACFE9C_14455 [Candidatus Hodarchaeota archaeon]
MLLISLIKDGDIPDWAVFIDGGNDTFQLHQEHDEPMFTSKVKLLWDAKRGTSSPKSQSNLSWIPMVRLARGLSGRLKSFRPNNQHGKSNKNKKENVKNVLAQESRQDDVIHYIVQRYTRNIRMIQAIS